MDVIRRWMNGRAIRTSFGLAVFFTLSLLWLDSHNNEQNSSQSAGCNIRLSSSDYASSMNRKRTELYEKMAAYLDVNGAAFLDGGETSQSLKLSDLFKIVNNKVTPVLKPANPAVRANVLHLHHEYASKIASVVEKALSPHFPTVIWYQDPEVYHFSLFHASHHLEPIPVSETEVQSESAAVAQVAKNSCPLEIVLDRVVLTSTGVLLGCWQVLNGTDPATIRSELRNVLPRSPKKQLYSPEVNMSKEEALKLMKTIVQRLNEDLCNFQATVHDLWFVEEQDILALALRGRMQVKHLPLQCASLD